MKRRTAADLLMQDLGELTEASVVDLTADAAAEAEPVAEVEEQVIIEEPAAPEPRNPEYLRRHRRDGAGFPGTLHRRRRREKYVVRQGFLKES